MTMSAALGGQVDGRGRDLVRVGEPARRDLSLQRLALLPGPRFAAELGEHDGGTDGVGRDSAAGPLRGEDLGQAHQSELRRAVGGVTEQSHGRGLRRQVDDLAATLVQHDPADGLAHQEGAGQVDRQGGFPIPEGQFLRGRERDDPGRVDQNVDASEGLVHLSHHAIDRGGIGDVTLVRVSAVSEFGRGALRRVQREVEDRDPRPLAGEGSRDRGADPRATAGDDRRGPRQAEVEIQARGASRRPSQPGWPHEARRPRRRRPA